jgi:hypothetical protein
MILKKENERYDAVINNDSRYKNKMEYIDLHNDRTLYGSLSHIIATDLVTLFSSPKTVTEINDIIESDIWPVLQRHEKYIAIDLNVTLELPIPTVNKILKTMYGLRLCKQGPVMKLKRCNIGLLFTFSDKPIKDVVTVVTKNKLLLTMP